MSLINDALNKVEQDRAAQRLAAYPGAPTSRRIKRHPHEKKTASRLLVFNLTALALVATFAVGIFLRERSPRIAEPTAELAATPATATTPIAPTAPPTTSTFTPDVAYASPFSSPPPTSTAAEPPPTNDYELAGMSALGDNTLISITRRSDQRSVWIPVGKSAGEITAVSYNDRSDEAVIRVNGRLLTVSMRSGPAEPTGPAAGPAEQAAE